MSILLSLRNKHCDNSKERDRISFKPYSAHTIGVLYYTT